MTTPKGLSAESRELWRSVSDEYGITDAAGRVLLETALRAFDRLREVQRLIARDGPNIKDRYDQPKAHPMLAIEKEARAGMIAALRALNLDSGTEPLKSRLGRPPGGRGL